MRGFFLKNYEKCWGFFLESRWYFVFALGVFGFMFLIGFAYPVFFREEIFSFLAKLVESLEGKNSVELIFYIFLNNLQASFFAIISGIAFGVFSLLIGVVNGYLVGFVAKEAVLQDGIFVLWRLAPHGIFELPAILLSIGVGLKLGVSTLGAWGCGKKKDWKKRVKYNFVEELRFFIFVIFPLLLVAGIIEGLLIGM